MNVSPIGVRNQWRCGLVKSILIFSYILVVLLISGLARAGVKENGSSKFGELSNPPVQADVGLSLALGSN